MKKNEKRFHIEVDGQVVSIYFQEKWNRLAYCYTYDVALRISNSKRSNNDWYEGGKGFHPSQVTGHCGLKGLLKAKDVILDFAQSLPRDDYDRFIVVEGADERRFHAYRALCKHGFSKQHWGGKDCYVMMVA